MAPQITKTVLPDWSARCAITACDSADCSNPDDRDPSRTCNSRDHDPGSWQAAVFQSIATEAVALSALAPDKCNNRERDGKRRPNHACENIERGLSAHEAPHCGTEVSSLETLCACRDFVSARIDARVFDAPNEVMRVTRAAA
jgi:hypothetical protein